MTSLEVKPFKIAIPEAEIGDLKDRLARTRWPDAIPGSDWTYGIDLAWTKEMAAYWRDGFDWREQEAMLNAFPQFTATIDASFRLARPLPVSRSTTRRRGVSRRWCALRTGHRSLVGALAAGGAGWCNPVCA
jgi:hypothetical protein